MHKVFCRLMAFALTGIAVLTVFAYPLGLLQSAVVGPVLALVLFLSPTLRLYAGKKAYFAPLWFYGEDISLCGKQEAM